jgi:hypothetical protein
MYVILIWKISINARSITYAISDIISYDFFQPLIPFLLYGKKKYREIQNNGRYCFRLISQN